LGSLLADWHAVLFLKVERPFNVLRVVMEKNVVEHTGQIDTASCEIDHQEDHGKEPNRYGELRD